MASSSSSSLTHQWKHEVFLSFRGEDTRKSFTDHLHQALCRKGIKTFIDDQLRRGEQISPALLRAIEDSRFSVIIFSENYASSSWCLDELVKILDCVKEMGHTALPVFYNVDPSHVRNQRESYAKAFVKHEQIYREKNMEKVVKWRESLTAAAGLSGWDTRDRHESKIIEEIATKIFNELIEASSSNMEALFGVDSHIYSVVSLLCIESNDVRMVGLWGMPGIGKTTIAEVVYERIYSQFEGCCFLSNVREKSQKNDSIDLQMELLSQILKDGNLNTKISSRGMNIVKDRLRYMKVLIVLDDVDCEQQLEDLARNHDWFGPGSRIIITSRDKHLLDHQVDAIYEVEELKHNEAHDLFCHYAFRQKCPIEDFKMLCDNALSYARGVPLALKVLGSFLYGKSIAEWKSELDKLKQFPNKKVQNVLKTSFDGLDDNEKDIFLDIAFFYKGHDKDFIREILDSCFFFDTGIRSLMDKSLITISKNKLCMHDLLQEMGWEVVRQESIKDRGKRSRLLSRDDVNHVLITNTGTQKIEGIVLDLSASKEINLSVEAFAKMNSLRLLRFYNCESYGSSEYLYWKELLATGDAWKSRNHGYSGCELHLLGDFKFLSNDLRSLHWHGYPLKTLPENFYPEKLVELNMCSSQLALLWKANKPFEMLKFIKLCHSQHLTKTPDFSRTPKLRRLILKDCTSLVEVHPSIGALKELIFLNLEGCKMLNSFPSSIHMESLQILILSGCSKLKNFPEVQGEMGNLSELYLDGTAIRELPSSIEHLNGLVLLNLANCNQLENLPESIGKLTSLQTLKLYGCSKLKKFPDELGSLQCLEELNADGTAIEEVPPSITLLSKLKVLSFAGCKGGVSMSWNLVFYFWSSLPRKHLRLPSLLGLHSLRSLNLSDCGLLEGALPTDLASLSSLQSLDLSRNSFVTMPGSLSQLSRLQDLILKHCTYLQSLPELPSSIQTLDCDDCTSLESFSCPSRAYASRRSGGFTFKFSNCFRIVENELQSDVLEAIVLGIQLVASIPKFLDPQQGGSLGPVNAYDAIVPGSSIPSWFIHQSMGTSSVKVELPPDWYNTNLMGLAACAVVDDREEYTGIIYFCVEEAGVYNTIHMRISMKADHMWFAYRSVGNLESKSNGEFGKQSGAMTVSFRMYRMGEHIEVKKCGVRLVYDLKEGECNFSYPPLSSLFPKSIPPPFL